MELDHRTLLTRLGPLECNQQARPGDAGSRQNVTTFLNVLRALGMPKKHLFRVEDLVEHRNDWRVLKSLLSASRYADLPTPKIIQVERAIEARTLVPETNFTATDLQREVSKAVKRLSLPSAPSVRPVPAMPGLCFVDENGPVPMCLIEKYLMVLHKGTWDTFEHYLYASRPQEFPVDTNASNMSSSTLSSSPSGDEGEVGGGEDEDHDRHDRDHDYDAGQRRVPGAPSASANRSANTNEPAAGAGPSSSSLSSTFKSSFSSFSAVHSSVPAAAAPATAPSVSTTRSAAVNAFPSTTTAAAPTTTTTTTTSTASHAFAPGFSHATSFPDRGAGDGASAERTSPSKLHTGIDGDGDAASVHRLQLHVAVQAGVIDDLRRRVMRLQWELDAAEAEKARISGGIEGRLQALQADGQRLMRERDEMEAELFRLRQEQIVWQERLGRAEAALADAAEAETAWQRDQQSHTRAVSLVGSDGEPLTGTSTAALNAIHETCEAQIAQLTTSVTSLQDQVDEWSQRHAISVAEYERTIGEMASKNVAQYLELDSSRDLETRRARQSNLALQVALDEQHARLSAQFAEEQDLLRKRMQESMAEKDGVIAEMQKQMAQFRAMAEQQKQLKEQAIASLQAHVDSISSTTDSTTTTTNTVTRGGVALGGRDWEVEQLKEALETSERGRASLLEHVQQQKQHSDSASRKLMEAHHKQMGTVLAENQATIEKMRESLRREVDEARQQHHDEVAGMEERIQAQEARIAKMQALHDNTVRELKDMHATKVASLSARLEKEAAALSDQYQSAARQISVMEQDHPRKASALALRHQSELQQAESARDRAVKELQAVQTRCTSLEKNVKEQAEAYKQVNEEQRQRHEHDMQQLNVQLADAQYERERLEAELEEFKLRFTDLELAIQRRLAENEQRLHEQQALAARQMHEIELGYERKVMALQQRVSDADLARAKAERQLSSLQYRS